MKRKILLALLYLSIGSGAFFFGVHNQKRTYSRGCKDALNFVISELENYSDSLKKSRDNMNKIKIEITPNGWESTVIIDGKEYKEKHVATAFGSESIEGNFESEDDIPEEVYDALNSSFPFECMRALYSIED